MLFYACSTGTIGSLPEYSLKIGVNTMVSNGDTNNLALLSKLENITIQVVDYYISKDNDDMLRAIKTVDQMDANSALISRILANEIQAKFKLA